MGEQAFFVEGTHFHATTTGSALLIGHPIERAFLCIGLPHLIAIVHDLVAKRDRVAGAFIGTFHAFAAEILKSKIDWLIDLHGQVSSDDMGFKPRPQKRIQNQLTDPA